MKAHFWRLGALIALSVFLGVCYFPMLWMTGRLLASSDDMAHGFFAVIVAAYIVWDTRAPLLHPATPGSTWSLAVLGAAAGLASVAVLANSATFSRLAFLISLAGCLLLLGGAPLLGRFAFPLLLLLFTFPVPDVLYGELTQPLQLLATRLSESALELLGFSVIREGNIIQMVHMRLSVVEACSGLRSLITLIFFCLVYAYFFETKIWIRAAMVLFAIPCAIAINALRITATGVLGRYDMAWTEGFYHEAVGWSAFALGVIFILSLHQWIRRTTRRGKNLESH